MPMDTIRAMVRDAIAEELRNLRRAGLVPPANNTPHRQVREEVVSIRSDAELHAFVARLAEILKDGSSREEIEKGHWVFRLGEPAASGSFSSTFQHRGAQPPTPAPSAAFARIEHGVISERQIDGLPPGTTCLVVGKSVRLTPLAIDRLRTLGIALKRIKA
jgi:hypothetical protein